MVTEHKRSIVEVCLISVYVHVCVRERACVCVCVSELSVNCMKSAEAFCEGNKSTAECVSVAITLIAGERARERKQNNNLYLLQLSEFFLFSLPFLIPPVFAFFLSLTNCFLLFSLFFFSPPLEFKTGRSGESVAGYVLYEYLSGAYSIKGRLINRLG